MLYSRTPHLIYDSLTSTHTHTHTLTKCISIASPLLQFFFIFTIANWRVLNYAVQLAPTFCFVSFSSSSSFPAPPVVLLLLSGRVLRAPIAFCVSVSVSLFFVVQTENTCQSVVEHENLPNETIGETDRRTGWKGEKKRGQSLNKKQFTPTVFSRFFFFFFSPFFSIFHSRMKGEVNWITKRERERDTDWYN